MRKILIITICSTALLAACNKSKKLNKSLDGTWITTSINGVPVTMADNPIQYQFSNSNNEGGVIQVTYFLNNSVDNEYTGTYEVGNEGKTITIDAGATPGSKTDPSSKIHLVDTISSRSVKKFTIHGNNDARRGFVFRADYVFEKQ